MIPDVDVALRAIIRDHIRDEQISIAFDAPTREWASKLGGPTIDLYLYDIREDVARRANGPMIRRDDENRMTSTGPAPRHYRLSYLVTAWTKRPDEEHRLLSEALRCLSAHDAILPEHLTGELADQRPLPLTVAVPPPQDRSVSDIWSAMGGELKPSLDLVVTAPMGTGPATAITKWATEVRPVIEPSMLAPASSA